MSRSSYTLLSELKSVNIYCFFSNKTSNLSVKSILLCCNKARLSIHRNMNLDKN